MSNTQEELLTYLSGQEYLGARQTAGVIAERLQYSYSIPTISIALLKHSGCKIITDNFKA